MEISVQRVIEHSGITVIIPTYQRAENLDRLLESLSRQTHIPEEIIVIVGPGDKKSREIVEKYKLKLPALFVAESFIPSVISALNQGLAMASEEVISLIDDDVWLPADWSNKIRSAFHNNESLGAFGGRDWLQLPEEPHLSNPQKSSVVGKFTWHGTLKGNHHCGAQHSPLIVDVLKGCNLSFRVSAFRNMKISTDLIWKGAETCWEIDMCQSIALAGFEIVYDNNNYVLHFVAPRLGYDNRTDPDSPAWSRRIYNEAFVIARFRPLLEFLLFGFRMVFVGSKFIPGIVWSILLLPKYKLSILKSPLRNCRYVISGGRRGFSKRAKKSIFKPEVN